MDYKEFFDKHYATCIFGDIHDDVDTEELYQAFKARLMDEVEAQHKIIHYTDPDGDQDIEIFRCELKNKVSEE